MYSHSQVRAERKSYEKFVSKFAIIIAIIAFICYGRI